MGIFIKLLGKFVKKGNLKKGDLFLIIINLLKIINSLTT